MNPPASSPSTAGFEPAWWCRNPHVQTLWQKVFRPRPRPAYRRERLELPDGDFIDLDWTGQTDGPIAVILHGLQGSSRSPYARGLSHTLSRRGWRVVVMHFRGCSGEVNRLPRGYHSGETGDLAYLIATLQRREPETMLAVIGYSLGGNVLLKWLGESGEAAPLAAAVAVSVPFDLYKSARRIERGFSRMYQLRLVYSMKELMRRKFAGRADVPIDMAAVAACRTFYEFDDCATAPLHGFDGARDYYARCSSRGFIKDIRVPTLILHAADDPFMTPDTVPRPDELSAAVRLELSRHGGHAGFVNGTWPWRPRYWLEQRISAYLDAFRHDRLGGPRRR